jgi:AAA family ATP:ADP antiporter
MSRAGDPGESGVRDRDELSHFESRVRWISTLTLALLMAAHTLMETGRDALFLTNIPVEHLPWVYIVVAFSAVVLSRLVGSSRAGSSARDRLLLLQALATTSVLGFWAALGDTGPWLYYALYVWSGVISGIVVVTFWMLLGDVFTITQGKRVFASIAIGGSFGALAGSGLANVLAPTLGADSLLLASAAFFGASLLGPIWLGRGESRSKPRTSSMPVQPLAAVSFREGMSRTLGSPYACRIAVLVALASATLTFSDYLFKSVLTEEVPVEDLSTWLARIYFGLNLASIAMLAIGVTPLVRRMGVDRSLAVLPALIGIATLGVFAGMAFVGIIVLKASDGMLRYSLHKTASELLFLPMESSLRSAVKGVIDLVGDSMAKAFASIAILGLVRLPESRAGIGAGLLLLSGIWTLSALRLRRSYLDVFRKTLQDRSIDTRIEFPTLDIDSIESLIQALSDPDERVVIAAMDLLTERDRSTLIPSLILYHPSPTVVERAIDIFAQGRHAHVLDFVERLIDHENPAVRSAIVRAAALLAPDRARLETLAHSTCPCVRISAVGGLIANDWIEPEKALVELENAVRHSEPDTRMAAANAAKLQYSTLYREPLCKLARDADPDVAREAVRAMRESDDPWLSDPLIGLLGDRRVRDEVRSALLDRGEPALSALARALEAPETPAVVRRHLPRTISRFETIRAIEILMHGLRHVPSGMVRYKILRGLQPLLQGPLGRSVDLAPLMAELEETIERTLFLLHREAELARGQQEQVERVTSGGRLLVDLLKDKRKLATSRIFLLLSLLHPTEDFRVIERGIRSDRPIERASGTELLEHLLPRETGGTLLGILTPGSPLDRLRAADSPLASKRIDYLQAVEELSRDASQAVRAFALYHAGEIEFERVRDQLDSRSRDEKGPLPSLRDRALEIIEGLPDALARQMLPADESAGH